VLSAAASAVSSPLRVSNPLKHLPRPPAAQTPAQLIFAAADAHRASPPEVVSAALLAALRVFPVVEAPWTKSVVDLVQKCLAQVPGVRARALAHECHVAGCMFVLATDTLNEHERLLQSFSRDPLCVGGPAGRLNTNPVSEAGLFKTLHI
jgi:hypothetical protein